MVTIETDSYFTSLPAGTGVVSIVDVCQESVEIDDRNTNENLGNEIFVIVLKGKIPSQ